MIISVRTSRALCAHVFSHCSHHTIPLSALIRVIFAGIGIILSSLGGLFTLLGVLFLFDRGLLAIGNVRYSSLRSSLPSVVHQSFCCICVLCSIARRSMVIFRSIVLRSRFSCFLHSKSVR